MPTLNWIGKDKVVNHHIDVPYRVLEHKYGFRADDVNDKSETHSGNKIIHGDNLEALKSLLPEYEGKIDCVYIDPPYNTGEEKWIYNDNVNDPHILKWLGEVVGKQGEDLSRHDKWLCMMYPRLMMLRKLLKKDGVIFISIDDNEISNLRYLCDSIFGQNNFVATFVWQKRYSRENREAIGDVHEYILLYSLDKKKFKESRNLIPMNFQQAKVYKNPNNDPKGRWRPVPMTAQAGHATKDQFYPITAPGGKIHYPPEGRCWSVAETTFQDLLAEGRIYFGADGNSQPNTIRYLSEVDGVVPWTWLPHEEVGNTDIAKKEIYNILGKDVDFPTPKPSSLIERILQIATNKDSIILDSFAGSASTAHAVMNLNKMDNGRRNFILVELMDYAEDITAERIKRVATGYEYKGKEDVEIYNQPLTLTNIVHAKQYINEAKAVKEANLGAYSKIGNPKIENNCIKVKATKVYDEKTEGLGGSFDFYELGEPIFDVDGNLNSNIEEDKIREYVFYTETRTHLLRLRDTNAKYLLDTIDGVGYYFYYEKGEPTTLSKSTLGKVITEKAEQYFVYANSCTLSKETLAKYNIVFKKITSDIKRF